MIRLFATLCKRAESGLVDADLGGGVIKQRVARAGQGQVGRLSHVDPVPAWRPRDIRFRVRQEHAGEHIESRLSAVA